jgi:hypothetical protein
MTRRLLALAFAALAGCGGMDALTAPTDAVLAAGIDSGAPQDAGDAIDTTPSGPCGTGYTLGHYSNPGTWCVPATDAGGSPCSYGTPINWAGGGVVRCPEVTP